MGKNVDRIRKTGWTEGKLKVMEIFDFEWTVVANGVSLRLPAGPILASANAKLPYSIRKAR